MSAYDITVAGCDDSTRVFGIELSDAEYSALTRVSAEVNRRGGGCAPTLHVDATPAAPEITCCMECFDTATAADGLTRNRYGEWCHAACVIEVA